MIFLQVFLAILAALFVIRIVVGLRLRRMGWHRWGPRGGHHGHHGRGPGAMGAWRIYRALSLSRDQKDQIRDLFRALREGVGDLGGDFPREIGRILGADEFDRVTAERMADERVAKLVRMKDQALDTLEKVHGILTPDQRTRLAAAL